jgi:hypothetical protein
MKQKGPASNGRPLGEKRASQDAADCGEYRQVAGAVAAVKRGECNNSKRAAPQAITLGLCFGLVTN